MTSWLRFVFIVSVIAVDDLLRELAMSFTTTRDFFRYRVRWILQDKARTMLKK
jgi:hypothetical protein